MLAQFVVCTDVASMDVSLNSSNEAELSMKVNLIMKVKVSSLKLAAGVQALQAYQQFNILCHQYVTDQIESL